MTQELLIAGEVEDITALLKTYHGPSKTDILMLLEIQPNYVIEQKERQDLLRFAFFDRDIDFSRYTSGRVFHQQGELRWEKQHHKVQVIYTGYEQYQPNIQIKHTIPLSMYEFVTKQYFLFGKRLDDQQLTRIGKLAQEGDFAEVRIPRLLRYPVLPALERAERVQLVVYEYRDQMTAVNVAFRFVELIGAK